MARWLEWTDIRESLRMRGEPLRIPVRTIGSVIERGFSVPRFGGCRGDIHSGCTHYHPCMKALQWGMTFPSGVKPVAQKREGMYGHRRTGSQIGRIVAVCHVLRYSLIQSMLSGHTFRYDRKLIRSRWSRLSARIWRIRSSVATGGIPNKTTSYQF